MSNPYASPEPPGNTPQATSYNSASYGAMTTINQVTLVAVFLIVQGVMAILMALFYLAYAGIMGAVLYSDPKFAAQGGIVAVVILAGCGLLPLISGVVQIVAGIRNLYFRARTLGVVALFSGLAQLLTCYCIPTAIGLLVYGLIIYLNADVKRAFAMGEQGSTKQDILAAFWQPPPGYVPPQQMPTATPIQGNQGHKPQS